MKTRRKRGMAIISALLWIHFLISSIILTPILIILWLLSRPVDKNLRLLHKFSCFWGAQYIWVNPLWSLEIINKHKFDDSMPHIMVCNHQSLVDIIVIYSLFKHFKWTSKAENFKLPFVGWVLYFNNSIKVYRGAKDAYDKFAHQARLALNAGSSIIIFPEGTRSVNGKLGAFKDGAFKLAHETESPILPMFLEGTAAAVPKKGWVIRNSKKITLTILDPLPYDSFKNLTVKNTKDFVRGMIEKGLEGR
jgi:1-acyl-sn-glycerol-3-phosphate acyltransferase